jgi:hypothetical protein
MNDAHPVLLLALIALPLGCSSGTCLTGGTPIDAGQHDANHDATAPRDAVQDTADSGDAGNVCPHVVGAADCPASSNECRATWAAVVANPVCLPGAIDYSREARFDCGGYHVSLVQHVDTSQTYYYDQTSGELVAIYSDSLVGRRCVAGPPSGINLDCPNVTPAQICTADAG